MARDKVHNGWRPDTLADRETKKHKDIIRRKRMVKRLEKEEAEENHKS